MEAIIIIGGFSTIHRVLKKEGHNLVLITETSQVKEKNNKLYKQVFAFDNLEDYSYVISSLYSLKMRYSFEGIVCMFDELQELTKKIADYLGIKYLTEEQVKLINNKFEMRKKLAEKKVDNIDSKRVSGETEIRDFLKENSPSILKPINGSASRSIFKVTTETSKTELEEYLRNNKNERLIIEEFVEGKEFSVETISFENRHYIYGITEKFKEEKHFVETGHIAPANISPKTKRQITDFVIKVLNCLGVEDTVSHTEVIVTKSGDVHIVETHARLGGDMITELYNLASNGKINPIRMASHICIGDYSDEKSLKNLEYPTFSGIKFLEFSEGKIKAITTDERKQKGYTEISVRAKVGDKNLEPSSLNRIGHVIYTNQDYSQVLNFLESDISKIIRVEYE